MTPEQFDAALLPLLRREPFQPFVVELANGKQVEIDGPYLAIGGGGATLFTPTYSLVEFRCDEVRDIF